MLLFSATPRWARLLSLTTTLVLLAPAIGHAQVPSYRVDIIDRLPGNVAADTLKVNESGQVLATGVRLLNGVQQPTALLWSGPGNSAAPALSGFTPRYITDSGNLVGGYNFGIASVTPSGALTMLTSGERFDYRTVAAVAPNGDYAGTDDFSAQRIYRSRGGVITNMPFFNTNRVGKWAGMNNNGDIAGTTDIGDGLTFSVAWVGRNGVTTKLAVTADGFTGGTQSIDIDSRGRVLGQLTNGTGRRNAIWDLNNVATLLPAPANFFTIASAFNASSTVLAQFISIPGTAPAFLGINTPGGNYSFASMVDSVSATWAVQTLQDISDSGYIVGTAIVPGGDTVAFRMSPISAVPEPGTFLSMALGGLGLALVRRRQTKAKAN